jgi:hypothetical protein
MKILLLQFLLLVVFIQCSTPNKEDYAFTIETRNSVVEITLTQPTTTQP